MKKIKFSPSFQKQLSQLQKKDKKLFEKVKKQLFLFKLNPRHSSLRLHKLKGNLRDAWSLSATMALRRGLNPQSLIFLIWVLTIKCVKNKFQHFLTNSTKSIYATLQKTSFIA